MKDIYYLYIIVIGSILLAIIVMTCAPQIIGTIQVNETLIEIVTKNISNEYNFTLNIPKSLNNP